MKINNSKLMFILTLMTSTISNLSSNNILFSWMMMEINLISFLPLLTKKKKVTDQIMKYLIIQSASSSIMLMSILINNILETPLYNSIMLTISMLMKMGMMPTHLWMPTMMSNISWNNCMILTTWQKIIPTTVICQMISMKMMMIPMILSLLMSPATGMKQLSMKKMMAYSSISNSPWMITSMYLSKFQFIYFMVIYSTMNILIMNMLKKQNILYMNQMNMQKKQQKMFFIIMILSISGMPPTMGFFPKWMILQSIINKSIWLSSSMILSSTMSTFMYMKLTSTTMMEFSTKKKKMNFSNKNISILMMNVLSIPTFMILKFI
uniref:NADH dehydrogenase subunit 2 n=1 Tax=Suva longipenna TaxID=3081115 RepID=UPI002A811F0E|nr:NADH dehydrogenase subunit 2 [Suva longipenna]WOW98931.1 NADH dehydrogenase subunit 2 [Suva longipenna]